MVLHEPWRKITQIPIDPTTKTFFTPDMRKRVGQGNAPFAAYIDKFGQSFRCGMNSPSPPGWTRRS